jgi:hypothetical protein
MTSTEIRTAANGVTIHLDIPQLLSAMYAYDADDGFPTAARDLVTENAARLIAKTLGDDIRREVGAQVREQVAQIVEQTMAEGVQETTTWGEPRGEKKPLRQMIVEQATAWMKEQVGGDSYSRAARKTRLQAFVAEQVDGVLQKELKTAVDQGKAEVLDRIKANAAAVITETVARMAKV